MPYDSTTPRFGFTTPEVDAKTVWQGKGKARDTTPEHYRAGGGELQPWDIWEAFELDAWTANAVKYLLRAGKKGPALDDLRKAAHYVQYLIEREEERGDD